ncbi:unnamed protein product [Owenia fusiformis]|uniref:glycerophosphodiester phosphodiesterase n=1 Tax=Owenia fusiformis TaxID=6347 RepID=A0A8S4NQN6_OWEFU|nr:unnamed protein product [Owenia fusiformis]
MGFMRGVIFLVLVTFQNLDPTDAVAILTPPRFDHGIAGLDTDRPLIVAHRGSSGMLPEHTVAAYELAVRQGADVLECDMCLTKDLRIVCLHESWIKSATDVESKPEFANRKTTRLVGLTHVVDNWFSVDFTLNELKTLRKKQQRSYRDKNFDLQFPIPTLQEMIDVSKNASRVIAIHVETKDPDWVNSLDIVENANTTFEDLLVDELERNGYTEKNSPVFLQSFSLDSIEYLANRTKVPLVLLLAAFNATDGELREWSTYMYGIGPSKSLIVYGKDPLGGSKQPIGGVSNLVARAHAHGLKVHTYTLRNEDRFLLWDYGQDPYQEYEKLLSVGIDGMFTDFPLTMKRYLDGVYNKTAPQPTTTCPPTSGGQTLNSHISYMYYYITYAAMVASYVNTS